MTRRTYLDANVLIAAYRGQGELAERAVEILDDPDRELILSDAVRLEVMPKPRYENRTDEVAFYETVLGQAEVVPWSVQTLQRAQVLAERYGIAALDAVHVAIALDAGAQELVTAENSTKPMFRARPEIGVRSIR